MYKNEKVWIASIMLAMAFACIFLAYILGEARADIVNLETRVAALEEVSIKQVETIEGLSEVVYANADRAGINTSVLTGIELEFRYLQRDYADFNRDFTGLKLDFMHCYLNDFDCDISGDE